MSLYYTINKQSISPLGFVFPIVWTILYILMGISFYLVYESDNPNKTNVLKTYAIQLFLNFWWSIIFFRFLLYLFAFLWLLVMIALVAIMIYKFYQINYLYRINHCYENI